MTTPRRKISHEERLERWGPAPDSLGMDGLLKRLLEQLGVNPDHVAEEIAWLRRESAVYKTCSRRTLSREPTMHQALVTIPPEFPPLRLAVGTSKNADIVVERLLPDVSYKVEYTSNGSRAGCFVRHPGAPQSYLTSIMGRPFEEVVEGLPDTREILRADNVKQQGINGIYLMLQPDIVRKTTRPVLRQQARSINQNPMTFADGSKASLSSISSLEGDARGVKMFRRDLIEYASFDMNLEGSRPVSYIAALPHANSKRPQFNLKGFHRDVEFDCYLARAEDVDLHQLAASMKAAKLISFNPEGLLQRLGIDVPGG